MSYLKLRHAQLILACFLLSSFLFVKFPGIDLSVSTMFFGKGFYLTGQWKSWIQDSVRFFLCLSVVAVVGLYFYNRYSKRNLLRIDGKKVVYLLLVLVLLASGRVGALTAGLAGLAGVVGGTALSVSPGEDTRYLLASLVVVIVGGMGSVVGAAIGAMLIGLAEQFGLAYAPTYSVVFTFVIMVIALAFKPRGLMGRNT